MHFYMPTKVYSERGCVRRYSQEWATLGEKSIDRDRKELCEERSLDGCTRCAA